MSLNPFDLDKLKIELLKYWLTDGCGPIFAKRVLLQFGFDFQSGTFSKKLDFDALITFAKKLLKNKFLVSSEQVLEELELAKSKGIEIVTLIDPHYPQALRNIYAPPIALTVFGKPALLKDNPEQIKLAIVGSRKATPYAFSAILKLLPELVANNFITVSGGALGVDSFVHKKSLELGGKTIVVLGSGILKPYPSENIEFFRSLVQSNGLIVSPFHLNAPPVKHNFPTRNRIIAGLSQGCLVIQAAVKSGGLITANFALDEGREVFAIPGPIDGPEFEGSNKLLASGACFVSSAQDILQAFGLEEQKILSPQTAKNNDVTEQILNSQIVNQSDEEDDCLILKLLQKHPLELEAIAQKLSKDFDLLESELFQLELSGRVEQRFDGLWQVR